MNNEGYYDPTADIAVGRVAKREEREKKNDVDRVIKLVKHIIRTSGFELMNRIELKDRATGKEYK